MGGCKVGTPARVGGSRRREASVGSLEIVRRDSVDRG